MIGQCGGPFPEDCGFLILPVYQQGRLIGIERIAVARIHLILKEDVCSLVELPPLGVVLVFTAQNGILAGMGIDLVPRKDGTDIDHDINLAAFFT